MADPRDQFDAQVAQLTPPGRLPGRADPLEERSALEQDYALANGDRNVLAAMQAQRADTDRQLSVPPHDYSQDDPVTGAAPGQSVPSAPAGPLSGGSIRDSLPPMQGPGGTPAQGTARPDSPNSIRQSLPPMGTAPQPEESALGAAARQFKDSWTATKGMGAAALAFAGDALGMDGLKNWALEKYQGYNQEQQANARPYDSLSWVIKNGTPSDFVHWAGSAFGAAGGFLLQQAAVAAAGGLVGTAVEPGAGTVAGLAAGATGRGLIEKAAANMLAKKIAAGMTEKEAVAAVGSDFVRAGQVAAGTGFNVGLGEGATYAQAREANQGQDLTAEQKERAGIFGAASGLIGEALNLAGLGSLQKGGMEALQGLPAAARVAGGAAIGGAAGAAGMGAMGALQDLGSTGQINPQATMDNAAIGLLAGAIPGAYMGMRSRVALAQLGTARDPVGAALDASKTADQELGFRTQQLKEANDRLLAPAQALPNPVIGPERQLTNQTEGAQQAPLAGTDQGAEAAIAGANETLTSGREVTAQPVEDTTHSMAGLAGEPLMPEAQHILDQVQRRREAGSLPNPETPTPESPKETTEEKFTGTTPPGVSSSPVRQAGEVYRGPEGDVRAIDIKDLSVARPGAPSAAGVTRGRAEAIQQALRPLGLRLQMFEGDGKVNGFYDPKDPNTVHLSSTASDPELAVVGHEIFHSIETHHPEVAQAFRDVVAQGLTPENAEKFKAYYGSVNGEQQVPGGLSHGHVREISADLFGNQFLKPEFLGKVADRMQELGIDRPGLFAKVGALIARITRTMSRGLRGKGFASDQMVTNLDKVHDAAVEAMAQYAAKRQIPARQMEAERLAAAHTVARYPLYSRKSMGEFGTTEHVGGRETNPVQDTGAAHFEIAPGGGPDKSLWEKLSPADRQEASEAVLQKMLPKVMSKFLLKGKLERQIGGWEGQQNPSFMLKLNDPKQLPLVSKLLGHVFNQKAMAVVSDEPHPGSSPAGEVLVHLPHDDYQSTQRVFDKLQELKDENGDPLVQGHSTSDGVMHILHQRGDGLAQKVQQHLGSEYQVQDRNVHISFIDEHQYGYQHGNESERSPALPGRGAADLLRNEASKLVADEVRARSEGGDRVAEGTAERSGSERANPEGVGNARTTPEEGRQVSRAPGENARGLENAGQVGHVLGSTERRPSTPEHPTVSAIGTHYSGRERPQLLSDYYGTGLRGAERSRLLNADDDRLRHRINFYVNNGNGIFPEAGVGAHAHEARLTNLYDATNNPLGIKHGGDMNRFESQVLDHGYDGYVANFGRQKAAVLLGKRAMEAKYVGTGPRPPRSDVLPHGEEVSASKVRQGGFTPEEHAHIDKFEQSLDDRGLTWAHKNVTYKLNDQLPARTAAQVDLDHATHEVRINVNPATMERGADHIRTVLEHETGHIVDWHGTLYSATKELNPAAIDLYNMYKNDPFARQLLRYPFDKSYLESMEPARMRAEIFAQGWAAFHDPYFKELMQNEYPEAYKFFDAAARDARRAEAGIGGRSHEAAVADFQRELSNASGGRGGEGVEAGQDVQASRARNELPDVQERDRSLLTRIAKNLTPEEKDKLNRGTAQKLVDLFRELPSSDEAAAIAWAGRAKRGWYEQCAQAIAHTFGPDGPRFAALLSALSPQQGVEKNLEMATRMWSQWVKAGRPQDPLAIRRLLDQTAHDTSGEGKQLYARVPNSIRALTMDDPSKLVLSGPKVDSFMRNLMGNVTAVTNDSWMAAYSKVNQAIFGGSLNAAGTEPGKRPGYLAVSAMVREAAGKLTKLTGENWTPAEVQETIWSWAKTLYEHAGAAGEERSAQEILRDGDLTHDLIGSTPDFRTLFHSDANDRVLRDAGYGDQLDSLKSQRDNGPAVEEGSAPGREAGPFARDTQARHEQRAAKRLDELRFERGESNRAVEPEDDEAIPMSRARNEVPDTPEGRRQLAEENELRAFARDMRNQVRSNAETAQVLSANHNWDHNVGDVFYSNKTGKTYELTGRTFMRVRPKEPPKPIYFYRSGNDETGMFHEDKLAASPTMTKLNGGDIAASRARASQDEWAKYDDLTPEQRKTLEDAGAIVKPTSMKQWLAGKTANWQERITTGLIDEFRPLMGIDPTNPTSMAYKLAKLAKGSAGTIEAMLRYGKVFMNGQAPDVDVNDPTGGYARVLSQLGGETQRALWWIAGQRAENLKKLGLENLLGDVDIQNLKNLNAGKMADGRLRRDVYDQFLKDHTEYNNAAIDVAERSGLISADTAQLFRDHPYVPFYRVAEDMNGGALGPISRQGLTDQKAWNKLKGGTAQLNADLLENTLQNWAHLFQASAKNRAALSTVDTLLQHHFGIIENVLPGMSTKGSFNVMRDGVAEKYVIHDPLVAQAVAGINYVAPGYLKPFGWTKRMLTAGITLSPFFRARIAVREALASLIQSPIGTNPLQNVAQGWKNTDLKSQIFASTLAGGGQIRFGQSERSVSATKLANKYAQAPFNQSTMDRFTGMLQEMLDSYHEFGNRVENFNRTALYEQLMKKGYSHEDAAFAARDLLDFTAQGKWAAVKFLASSVPFFNARLQGLYSIGKTMANDPAGMLSMKNKVTAITTAAGLASLGLMLSQQDEDWWQQRTDQDRDAYWAFRVGNTIFRLPKPFEMGAVATEFERTWELLTRNDMTAQRYASNIGQVLLNSLSFDPTPQLVKPLWGVYANRDPFSQRPIETSTDQKMLPSERYDENTSQVARVLGSLGIPDPVSLAQATYRPLDPKQIDYLLRAYGGAVLPGAAALLDYASSPFRAGESTSPTLRSLTGSFVSQLPENQSRFVEEFYQHADRVNEAYESLREAIKSGNVSRAEAIAKEHPEIKEQSAIEATSKQLAALNRQAKQVVASTVLSSATKRKMLDDIEQKRAQIAERAQKAA